MSACSEKAETCRECEVDDGECLLSLILPSKWRKGQLQVECKLKE